MNMLMPPPVQGGPAPGSAPPSAPPMAAAGMQGMPGAMQGPPQPQDLQGALAHADQMTRALLSLSGKKPGTLTKKDVFGAAADMIKGGLFTSPDAKQQLIGELANLPDDEPSLRMAIGAHLLRMADVAPQLKALANAH